MYKVTLKQGCQETELKYDTASKVTDLLLALHNGKPEDGIYELTVLITFEFAEDEF